MSAVDTVASATPLNTRPPSREPSQAPFSHSDIPPSTVPDAQALPTLDAALTHEIPQSQPTTATAAASSQIPNADDGDPDAAATYGTRSRNRPGALRPNYADDKELDMEIEAAGRISKGAPKKASTSHVADAFPAPLGFAAINSVAIVNSESATQANTAAPVPAASKKRKQPGSTSVSNGGIPSYTAGPRSKAAHSAVAYIETNMMSFSRCGGKLNSKKQLVSDDGTTLAPNGPSSPRLSPLHVLTDCRSRLLDLRASWRTLLSCTNHGIPPCWQ